MTNLDEVVEKLKSQNLKQQQAQAPPIKPKPQPVEIKEESYEDDDGEGDVDEDDEEEEEENEYEMDESKIIVEPKRGGFKKKEIVNVEEKPKEEIKVTHSKPIPMPKAEEIKEVPQETEGLTVEEEVLRLRDFGVYHAEVLYQLIQINSSLQKLADAIGKLIEEVANE